VANTPPTRPRQWRAQSEGVKQINIAICTSASSVRPARGGTGPAGVHSSSSRATSDPVAFQNKTRDQAHFLEFSVKRPFQNETN
jgi:hypothetical protein